MKKNVGSEIGVCATHCRTAQRCARPPGARHGRCATSWRTVQVTRGRARRSRATPESEFPTGKRTRDGRLKAHHDLQATPARPGKATRLGVRGSIMDLKQPRRKDTGLGPVIDKSIWTHDCTMIASSRGYKGRYSTSDYSAVQLHESHPGASSSFPHHSDASYNHDIHQRRIPMSPGAQYPALMVSYALGFGDVRGSQGDDTTIQAGGDDQGLDVGEGQDDHGEEEEGDQDENQEEEGSEDREGVTVSFLGHLGRDETAGSSGPSGVACTKKMLKKSETAWQQTEPAPRGPQEPSMILSYSGHVVAIWRGHSRPILRLRGRRHVIFTSYTSTDADVRPETEEVQEDGLGAAAFALLYRNFGQPLRSDAPELGELHMLERCVRQFGQTQGIPNAPIISPIKHYRPASTESYIMRHTFNRAFCHLRIQNLELLLAGVELPPRAQPPAIALVDSLGPYVGDEDPEDFTD
ncbi:hypothetical protein M9H77_07681 [Catharanthus roseus]|uniref:Uncharacterized protein n=1 Tax=Catharanthus roseus TaxID=4058 RepID=A0ACC0BVR5_CATRO|nr:hypothetical protein M9H77_07681 [Catharanthus roseus]